VWSIRGPQGNITNNEPVIIETTSSQWVRACHDDISAFLISLTEASRFSSGIPTSLFVREIEVTEGDIGPGDDVFMLGRFVTHDGGLRNQPSVRFGNISMIPADLQHPYLGVQESFVVEMRSISGYSGSPAFVFTTFLSGGLEGAKRRPMTESYLALLGIDWGHIDSKAPLYKDDGSLHPERLHVKSSTAMSGVVPAWKIARLLEKLREQRDRVEGLTPSRASPDVGDPV
jgi:hypothetical protein